MTTQNEIAGIQKIPIKEGTVGTEPLSAANTYDSLDYQAKLQANESMQSILSSLTELRQQVVLISGNLVQVNWLDDWAPFRFADLEMDEINARKFHIELLARGYISLHNSNFGTNFEVDTVDWETVSENPLVLKLQVFLSPPARRRHGGGQGTMTPQTPPQPPPPPLG